MGPEKDDKSAEAVTSDSDHSSSNNSVTDPEKAEDVSIEPRVFYVQLDFTVKITNSSNQWILYMYFLH